MTRTTDLSLGALIRADHARFRALSGRPGGGSVWRAFLHPRVSPVAWFRVAHWLHARGLRHVAGLLSLFVLMVFKVEIPARAAIGPGLVLPHPMGIVIGSASIGANVTIFQNVTLGAREFDGAYDLSKRPVLEDGVTIGSGAVVLGPVTVARDAVVRANALITRDVEARVTLAEGGDDD